jgi:hypothetical protein
MEFGKEDIEKAISVISTTIANCEKAQMKFSEGTSQHSLLRNRIKALNISKSLLSRDKAIKHTNKDLRDALPPIVKCPPLSRHEFLIDPNTCSSHYAAICLAR